MPPYNNYIWITGLLIIATASYINGQGSITIQEQYPMKDFVPTGNGPKGHCDAHTKDGDLEKYLQPDDVQSGAYDYQMDNPRSEYMCTRTCKSDEPPKICYYRFDVERYVTMGLACKDCPNKQEDCKRAQCITADGYERSIITVNRQMPGPSIQVCENDLIVVDVKNRMAGSSITVHWHGITQQGTPYMDGVPMVTQCPILEGQIFRYYFQPNNPGLFFWHSHSGLQKVDGFLGSLVVRRPVKNDPNGSLYDFDLPSHVVVIQDWLHETSDSLFPGLRRRRVGQHPDTYLINGRGVFKENGQNYMNTPYSVFNINSGHDYIFRVIGATCLSCPFRFQIEGHKLWIIGTDGRDTEPKIVDSVVLSAGERIKVIVKGMNLNQLQKQNYYMHVTATGICMDDTSKPLPSQQAILRYLDFPYNQPPEPPTRSLSPGVVMNEANTGCNKEFGFCYMDLVGAEEAPIGIKQPKPDYRLILGMDFYNFHNNTDEAFPPNTFKVQFNPSGNTPFVGHLNGIVNEPPPSPVLTQLKDVPECLICPTNHPYSQWHTPKECLHIYRVLEYPSIVELVIVDIDTVTGNKRARMSHPMHLHGYDQYLIAEGIFKTTKIEQELPELLKKLDNNPDIPDKPILKDTFLVPSGGYVVYRIIADNPGFWILHCHLAYHAETGMAAVIQIGQPADHPDPPDDFPTCKDFLPMPRKQPKK